MYGYGNYNTNAQLSIDRINNQIKDLENMRSHLQNVPQPSTTTPIPTNLTQNFQLAPNNQSGVRYANNIEEVKKEFVVIDTPFFDKNMNTMWLKNAKGEIKTYELNEIILKDEKDMLIESLQMQINDLRRGLENAKSNSTNDDDAVEEQKPTNVRTNKSSKSK